MLMFSSIFRGLRTSTSQKGDHAVPLSGSGRSKGPEHAKDRLTILVEEEESIRRSWEAHFRATGRKLKTYASATEFIPEFVPTGDALDFFFDQDFGTERGVGLRLAAYVRPWKDRLNTGLVTAYPKSFFEEELDSGLIDDVHEKFPEHLFGPEYFNTHMKRRFQDEGAERVWETATLRIHGALEHLEAELGSIAVNGGVSRDSSI